MVWNRVVSGCVQWIVLVFLCSKISCYSQVNVYRYVDDNINLISNDDYYNNAPFSASVFSSSPLQATTYRPQPSRISTRYPIYVRSTPPNEFPTKEISLYPKKSSTTTTTTTTSTTTTSLPTRFPFRRSETVFPQSTIFGEKVHLQEKGSLDNRSQVRLEKPSAEVFLTRGNTEDTVPLGLSTKDKEVSDIVISESMVRNGNGEEFNHVILLCNSSYPIEWIYEGVGAPRLYTTQIRTFGNFFDSRTYGHSSIVVLVQDKFNERQTGSYICRGIEKPELRTGFHLYFKGEFGFPSLQNVLIQPKTKDSTVMLPCPTTDPGATIGLYKITSSINELRNLTYRGTFQYDPKKGFSMKMSDMSNPYGIYTCKFNDTETSWKIDVVQPKEEEVWTYPNKEIVEMDNLIDHRFICKAKEPIQIMLPNTVNLGVVTYQENRSEEFPYQATLNIVPNIPLFSVANYFKVNCQSRKTRRILHTWEYSNFGTEVIRISYDKDHKRLLCCSKSGLTPIHEMAKCDTVTYCNIKKHCFDSGRCDYAFPPKFVDAPRGCTAVQFNYMEDFPSHVLRCSVGGNFSKKALVSSNIANDDLIIYNGTVPTTEEILKMVPLRPQGYNMIGVRCVASIFYFSTNIVFAFEQEDGSLMFVNETNIDNVNSYGPSLNSSIPPGAKKVLCFAPLTRSSEWRNASMEIIEYNSGSSHRRWTSSTPLMKEGRTDTNEGEEANLRNVKIVTAVKSSTSVSTYLRKKKGHLVKVMQDI